MVVVVVVGGNGEDDKDTTPNNQGLGLIALLFSRCQTPNKYAQSTHMPCVPSLAFAEVNSCSSCPRSNSGPQTAQASATFAMPVHRVPPSSHFKLTLFSTKHKTYRYARATKHTPSRGVTSQRTQAEWIPLTCPHGTVQKSNNVRDTRQTVTPS